MPYTEYVHVCNPQSSKGENISVCAAVYEISAELSRAIGRRGQKKAKVLHIRKS